MVQRVVLHVGCPKTGTTGIQHQLLKNPIALAAQGFAYPSDRPHENFLAVLDLLDLPWGPELKEESVGAWDALVGKVTGTDLDVIISHELLARAMPEGIERAVKSLGDIEISVVITARDLGRQLPAEYQEHLKHRSVMTYRLFFERLQRPDVDDFAGGHARTTWLVQDVPAIAERWASVVGAENVTIVTVPPSGSPREFLMQRFGEAVGFDAGQLRQVEDLVENRSLGASGIAMLRRFNERYNDELEDRAYAGFVRHRLVARRAEVIDVPLVLPSEYYPWVRERSEQWLEALRAGGYPVIGDLDELLPAEPAPSLMPDDVDEGTLFETALRALVDGIADFEELVESLPERRERLGSRLIRRSKERVVHEAGKRPLGQRALRAWEARH